MLALLIGHTVSFYIWLFSGQSHVFVDKLHCYYLTTNSFCPTFINQVSVVQLQAACGPPQHFQWPTEAFRKNLQM